MLVHVVTAKNADDYRDLLDQFFHERHKIYAEDLKWVPETADRREYDQFDTDDAIYLIGEEEGRVIAGSRFVPTHRPHMLSEVFPHLCTKGGVLRDPAIAEWTRGFVVKDRREGLSVKLKAQFCYAVMEYCLAEDITRIGGIQEVFWLSLWRRLGWNVTIHGEPSLFGADQWVPAYFDVTEQALAGAKRWAKVDSSILVHEGGYRPFIGSESAGLIADSGRG